MIAQLDFTARLCCKRERARVGPRIAARMIARLCAAGGAWIDRRAFEHDCGLTDRQCRLGRAASNGRIITGQRGYKLMRDATPDEIAAHLANIQAQIAALQRQHALACRRAHASIGRAGNSMAILENRFASA